MVGVDRGKAQLVRGLAEGHSAKTPLGIAQHLLSRDLRVEQVRDLAGNEPIGVGAGPLLDVPVIVRAHDREGEFGVVGGLLQSLTGEPDEA